MKKGNRAQALIAWCKGQFVAFDAAIGRPAHYMAAISETEKLFNRLIRTA